MSSKLTKLLQPLSRPSLNRLGKLVRSTYFNEQEPLEKLFAALDNALRKDPENLPPKETFWNIIHPNLAFDNQRYRRYCSDLIRLVEQFYVAEWLREKPSHHQLLLVRALREKNLLPLTQSAAEELLEKDALLSADQSLLRLQLEDELAGDSFERRTALPRLDSRNEALDQFYILKKIRLVCENLNHQQVFQNAESHKEERAALEQLLLGPAGYHPLVAAWHSALLTFGEEENLEHFNSLVGFLDSHGARFAEEDRRNLYKLALNYCIRRSNRGHTQFYEELFHLYRKGLSDGFLFFNNELAYTEYKNIITVSLHLNEFVWAEAFIHQYTPTLPERDRANAYSYNLAKLYFEKGDHGKVIELLRDVVYDDVFYAIGSRWMLVRTYFETQEFLALDALIESFRHFLRRSRSLSREHQREYLNALRLLQKLSNMDPRDKKARGKLAEEIGSSKHLYGRRWFLEKVTAVLAPPTFRNEM